jgi:hypothetical protein
VDEDLIVLQEQVFVSAYFELKNKI